MAVQEHEEFPDGSFTTIRVEVLTKDPVTEKYMVRYTDPVDGSTTDFEIATAGTNVSIPSPTPTPTPTPPPPEEPVDPDREPSN